MQAEINNVTFSSPLPLTQQTRHLQIIPAPAWYSLVRGYPEDNGHPSRKLSCTPLNTDAHPAGGVNFSNLLFLQFQRWNPAE